MFKYLKNEKGEALLIFLFGLMFTMIVSAKATSDLKTKLVQCETPQNTSITLNR